MRVTVICHNLGLGGTQRVAATLANHWAGQGWDVHILTLQPGGGVFFALAPGVTLRHLDLPVHPRSLADRWRLLHGLRRAILETRPDVVLSLGDVINLLALLALVGRRLPVVVSERTHPDRVTAPAHHRWLAPWLYRRAAAVVVQTPDVAAYYRDRRGVRPERLAVIPNAVQPGLAQAAAAADPGPSDLRIVGLGRLVPEKGFDLLVRAFARLAGRAPAWRLVIGGDGPERAHLLALARDLGVAGRVDLPGAVPEADVPAFLARSALFALPSRWEGFPNALLEAMAVGTAAVACDCEFGPRAIIHPGVDGVLVPPDNPDALANALAGLVGAPDRRAALGQAARHVAQTYSLAAITRRWDDLLTAVAAGCPPAAD